jgi:formylglycine-generating enzyme required for sulfatase activity
LSPSLILSLPFVNRVVSLTCAFLAAGFCLSQAIGSEHRQRRNSSSTIASQTPPTHSTQRSNHVIADLDLELIWINPGTFTMGSPLDEQGRDKAEGPQHRVTLTQGFWLGRTEVTQRQYRAVTGKDPSRFKETGSPAPVEEVSWLDAMEFCRLLTARERGASRLPDDHVFTLPTEAQWEYACRAGTTGAFAGNPDAMAWYKSNSGDTTHPVGQKEPNPWGLYDMYGNVLEWCRDWYGNYPRGERTDPTGPEAGYFRIARGGSWRVEVFRSASRAGGSPGRRDYTMGFRLALCPQP